MTTTASTGEYMTVAEVAKIFRVSDETVRLWVLGGKFPHTIQPGRSYLILRSDVTAILEGEYGA